MYSFVKNNFDDLDKLQLFSLQVIKMWYPSAIQVVRQSVKHRVESKAVRSNTASRQNKKVGVRCTAQKMIGYYTII